MTAPQVPKTASVPPPTPRPIAGVVRTEIDKDEFLDMQDLDPSTMDPKRHYRAVRATDAAIAKARRRGFDIELYKEGGVRLAVDQPTGGDGVIKLQDRVLMSCPKERHESRQRAKVRRTAERLGSVSNVVKEKAAAQGVKIITDKE